MLNYQRVTVCVSHNDPDFDMSLWRFNNASWALCYFSRVLCLSSLFSLISRHPTDLVWDRDNMHPFLLLPHDTTEAPSVSQLASFADDHRSPLATPRSNTDVAARPLGGSAKCIHRLMMMPMMPMPVVLPLSLPLPPSLSPSLSLSIACKDAHFDFTEPLAATRCNKFLFQLAGRVLRSRHSPRSQWMRKNDWRGCSSGAAVLPVPGYINVAAPCVG